MKHKTLKSILFTAPLFFLMAAPFFAIAADYVPLAPLPGQTGGGGVDIGGYFSNMFTLIIGIAGVLAVLMIVIAGIEYMSPMPSSKESGKNRALAAIFGLLLALVSYLILQTINPDLVVPKLDLTNTTSKTQ